MSDPNIKTHILKMPCRAVPLLTLEEELAQERDLVPEHSNRNTRGRSGNYQV